MDTILIVAPFSYPSKCGVWERAYSDAKILLNQGYDVHVVASTIEKGTGRQLSSYEEFEGIKIHRFRPFLRIASAMFFFYFKVFKEINPDVVHFHGYRHPTTLFGLIYAKRLHKKTVLTPHGSEGLKNPNRSIFLKIIDWLYDRIFGRIELNHYDKVVLVSEWEEKELRRIGLRTESTILIPNSIKKDFTDNAEKLKSKIDKESKPSMNILAMMRIDPIKRLEWVVDAAKKVKSVNFKIWGPLNEYKQFKSESDNLEVITEPYSTEDFIEELSKSDIYILPSVRESFGITALEAMSQGVIVLSTPTLGVKEYLDDGVNGFEITSIEGLTEKIKEIYNSDWSKYKSIRKNAIETASKFSVDVTSSKLSNLYKSLLGEDS